MPGVPSQQDIIDNLIAFALEAIQVASQVQGAIESVGSALPIIGRKKRSILTKILLPEQN